MTKVLTDADFLRLSESLPLVFRDRLKNEAVNLAQAYPLLDKICKDRALIEDLRHHLKLAQMPSGQHVATQLLPKFELLSEKFNIDALFVYRLPIVLSEFPLHSRAINKTIKLFNRIIENYHRSEPNALAESFTEDCFQSILQSVKLHGSYCDTESLWQLLGMMAGWSTFPVAALFDENEYDFTLMDVVLAPPHYEEVPIVIKDIAQPVTAVLQQPFMHDFSYNINGAGRLASETYFLLLNAFGMKIGGHFDAQVKYSPRFIPLEQLHAMIRRQLSHRLEFEVTEAFQLWIELTLHQLGIEFIGKSDDDCSRDLLVNPFFKEPISFLSPEKIHALLKQTLIDLADTTLNPSTAELEILAQYLYELVQGFQVNPGQALGIGANWDGTINLSNESGTEAFKFNETHTEWGRRFKQLSLHRQGPSEARMNAAIGIKFEFQTLLSDFDYMSQLQPSEYRDVLYNAIVDNLITDLFPEPPYFENVSYQKYRKQHVAKKDANGLVMIEGFYTPNVQGTYFKDNQGREKQTPMYRRAGTLDVQAFPRDSTYSEQSRVCYEGNPLGPLQLQYAQAMIRNTRGHVVYDPIEQDQFLEDSFYGQVMRGMNDDYLPFIGVVPKNFDKHFEQDQELCASFVIRMLQSSQIINYCPTFNDAYEQLKSTFLPHKDRQLPPLPKCCSSYIQAKVDKLAASLTAELRAFNECEKLFYSVFKNLIYSLYEMGREDESFRQSFFSYIHLRDTMNPVSKAKCEKLIREFTVNRPVQVSADALLRYDEIIVYLRQLTALFYPYPTDEVAKQVALLAGKLAQSLLQSPSIVSYFESLAQNKQTNFSRKQTPGMLYSALKHNGPSKTVVQDYRAMHQDNFPSYFRDPDGTPNGEPQINDKLLDWGAKNLGAFLQILHKYELFAVIHKPISQPILRAREQAALRQFDKTKPLWILQGVLRGIFWDGLVLGLWETAKTPIMMALDVVNLTYRQFKKKTSVSSDHPLRLPAAPANESSVKSLTAGSTRDYLLKMMDDEACVDRKKEDILVNMLEMIAKIYPLLAPDDLSVLNDYFHESINLHDASWNCLYIKPFEFLEADSKVLAELFSSNASNINNSLIQAVFRYITHPGIKLKDVHSFFSLNAKQQKLLADISKLYHNQTPEIKKQFTHLFCFNGVIHRAMQTRDQHLQIIQSFILQVFNEQAMLEKLLEMRLDSKNIELTSHTIERCIRILPDSIKLPLKLVLASNNISLLAGFVLSDAQYKYMCDILNVYQVLPTQDVKNTCIHACDVKAHINENIMSEKDKAHYKWAKFSEQQFKHQLLTDKQIEDLFTALKFKLRKLPAILPDINRLNDFYLCLKQGQDKALEDFYDLGMGIRSRLLNLPVTRHKIIKSSHAEAQVLITNLLNTTMNVMVNSSLANVDILLDTKIENPLVSVNPVTKWLVSMNQTHGCLRSLLEQQVQQSPSIDHALWRCKCILQVLEKFMAEEKMTKTGMKSLVRFWRQHKENVTVAGERYVHPLTGEGNMSRPALLFDDCATLKAAVAKLTL